MMMTSAGYDDDVIRMFIGQTFGLSSAGGCSSDGSGCADEGEYHAVILRFDDDVRVIFQATGYHAA